MVEDVGKYLLEGRKLAALLGPTFERVFWLREKKCDQYIARCVQDLVKERKSKMFYMVTFTAPETAATPGEADCKQIVKGKGRGRRRMSNSQGI